MSFIGILVTVWLVAASGVLVFACNRPAIYRKIALPIFAVGSIVPVMLFIASEGARIALSSLVGSYSFGEQAPIRGAIAYCGYLKSVGGWSEFALAATIWGAWEFSKLIQSENRTPRGTSPKR